MILAIKTWWAKRCAIAAWRERHGVLPRFDPETGCRLFWRFEMKPATSKFDEDTGLPRGGWCVEYAKAWRRKPGEDQNDMIRPMPYYWIVRQAGSEPELVEPRRPTNPPTGGSSVRRPTPQPRRA